MFDLDQAIRERYSARMFLRRPVPPELVSEAVALAQHAPSNSPDRRVQQRDWE